MKRSALHYLLPIACCLLALSSCKPQFSFTGASISPDVKTVSIQYFKNNAPLAKPTLGQTFTEALKDIFVSQTNLAPVQSGGDISFEGEIVNYVTGPVAIQSNDQAALNRLTITVSVKFTNTKEEKKSFEATFSRYADYPSSQSLDAAADGLIQQINEQLVQDIFNKAMINW